jgi:hypothetical protein
VMPASAKDTKMPLLEILPQGSFRQRVLVGLREAPQSRTANALSNWIRLGRCRGAW